MMELALILSTVFSLTCAQPGVPVIVPAGPTLAVDPTAAPARTTVTTAAPARTTVTTAAPTPAVTTPTAAIVVATNTTAAPNATEAPGPVLIPNNCSVTLEAGQSCMRFGDLSCPAATRFDITMCRCEHAAKIDPLTCEPYPDPTFIANACNVKILAGIGCSRFGQQTCANGTAFDVKWCVCNHEALVNKVTCSSNP